MIGKPRGRPRDEHCSPAVLAATIEVVSEVGIARLTMDAVAARAGVGKATIYRRWSSKEALVLDAWKSCVIPRPTPDTGSLRTDVQTLFSQGGKAMSDEVLQRVFPQMVAAAKVNPEVAEAYHDFVIERRKPLLTVLERAIARGELAADTDLELVHDMLIAPLNYRFFVTDGVIDDSVVGAIVDLVLNGIRAGANISGVNLPKR